MTRINIGINPSELCDQHLLAEHHELPRVWQYAVRLTGKDLTGVVPELPCLGKGHVLYFVNKGSWLYLRWQSIQGEMLVRGMSPSAVWRAWPGEDLCGDEELPERHILLGRALLTRRLLERMPERPRWTSTIPPTWAMTHPNVRKEYPDAV